MRTPSDIVDRYRTGEAVLDSPPGVPELDMEKIVRDCGRGGASRGRLQQGGEEEVVA